MGLGILTISSLGWQAGIVVQMLKVSSSEQDLSGPNSAFVIVMQKGK